MKQGFGKYIIQGWLNYEKNAIKNGARTIVSDLNFQGKNVGQYFQFFFRQRDQIKNTF